MNSFEQYLSDQRIIPDKKIPFFLHWVKHCYAYNKKPTLALTKHKEDWQVEQARMAIHLYVFHKNRLAGNPPKTASAIKRWSIVKSDMVRIMRLKHLSLDTEKTYIGWLRSFARVLNFRSPDQISCAEAKFFLTWLAVKRRVAASTQRQAFHALLFFFGLCSTKISEIWGK